MRKKFIASLLLLASLFIVQPAFAQVTYTESQPRQVVLTWQNDPATTMTITWRTDIRGNKHSLRFGQNPRRMKAVEATTFTFDETKAWLHTVELKNLKPGTKYFVEIDHPALPDRFSFQTMPDQNNRRELVILAGGDSRSRRDVRREMNELAALQSPDFVIFDGDFISTALNEQQWDDWFDDWHELMITPDGRRVPVVPNIGNHEVDGSYLQPRENAPFYFNRFIVPEPRSYYALKLSPEMVLLTLDTDHIVEVEKQTGWLDKTLTDYKDTKWKIVQYHVAAWPSVRDFEGELPRKIRENWVPVLEKHNVNLVIEAHDHAYKKTVPIRNNRQDNENGIVYLGDGGWGAPIRDTKNPEEFWWLEEAVKIDHFWKLILSKDGKELKVEPVFRPAGKSFVLTK